MFRSWVTLAGICAATCGAVACGSSASPPGGPGDSGGVYGFGNYGSGGIGSSSGGFATNESGGVPFGSGGESMGNGGYDTSIGDGSGGAFGGGSGGSNDGNGGFFSSGGSPSSGGFPAATGGMSGAGGATTTPGTNPPADKLPTVTGTCPSLTTGPITVNGTAGNIWVGTKPGPMYIYWHATGTTYTEIDQGMPGATSGVATNGGIALSFNTTNNQGTDTGDAVWFTGDFDSSDQVLACGIQKGLVDTSRIYTAGYSAGGLQACAMVATRGKYLAAAICYSGGAAIISGTPQDTSNLPATLLLHGAAGKDTFILDFNAQSQTWANQYTTAGGFAINCDDGGDHITSAFTRMGFGGRAMPFLQAHTWHQTPEPYDPLPSDWPSYCTIWTPNHAAI